MRYLPGHALHRRPPAPLAREHAFEYLERNVKQSIDKLRNKAVVPRTDNMRGFVYEVETGRLRAVSGA